MENKGENADRFSEPVPGFIEYYQKNDKKQQMPEHIAEKRMALNVFLPDQIASLG